MPSLAPVEQKFILHWGEMGARWGVNRTVAQLHALLYLSPQPLPAEEIATTLAVARSNVSTSLRELQSWGIVRVVHVLRVLRECVEEVNRSGSAHAAELRDPLLAMLEFLTTMMTLYEEVQKLPPAALRRLVKLRGKMRKLLG